MMLTIFTIYMLSVFISMVAFFVYAYCTGKNINNMQAKCYYLISNIDDDSSEKIEHELEHHDTKKYLLYVFVPVLNIFYTIIFLWMIQVDFEEYKAFLDKIYKEDILQKENKERDN